MPIGNGGIIGPANIPTIATASGVWSLREQQQAQGRNAWPLALAPDPYFEYTTLLLPGNGTNGAQNNTFLDGSTNNFTITRNGNTTQGTFSPFSQTGWGNYFGGSGNYLKVADGTALDLPGDFTLEGWFYFSSLSSNNGIIGYGSEAASQNGFSLYWAASGVNKLRIYSNGATLLTGTTTLSANTWNHIAIVRSGSGSNNLTVYVNGAVDQTATNTTSFTGVAALGMGIGVNYDGTFYNPFTGYASNIRLVKGQALATGAFTPPTSPVSTSSVGWTGANAAASLTGTVSVLTCQSNRFVDNSSSPLAITVTGSPSVQSFSPFNPTASWSAATYGGSGYFDGSGDYLSVGSNAALAPASGDFCLEMWVYLNTIASSQIFYGATTTNAMFFYFNGATKKLILRIAAVSDFLISSASLVAGQWYHLAVNRSGTSCTMWINGSSTDGGTATSSHNFVSGATYIGSEGGTTGYLNGYVASLRFVKGSSVYSGSTITVPTAPLTAITNTSLLLNFTNAGIYDATSKNDLETVGNAQISNTTAKWGSTSIKFDNTGDWLAFPSSNLFAFGTGDFTIEAWGYPSTVGGAGSSRGLFQITSAAGLSTSTTNSLAVATTNPSAYWGGIGANAFFVSTTAAVANTWYHLALVRNSGTTKLYVNGTSVYSFADTTNYTCSFLTIAGYYDTNNLWNGYIQDFRVTKGYARYTTNFTAPTAAFPTL